jgi:hypothetical protein
MEKEMEIKYLGQKPRKVVTIAGKEYVFSPMCMFNEVFDLNEIKWLLHPDRAGLFEVVSTTDLTPSASMPNLTVKSEKPERPKKRGRKKKGE